MYLQLLHIWGNNFILQKILKNSVHHRTDRRQKCPSVIEEPNGEGHRSQDISTVLSAFSSKLLWLHQTTSCSASLLFRSEFGLWKPLYLLSEHASFFIISKAERNVRLVLFVVARLCVKLVERVRELRPLLNVVQLTYFLQPLNNRIFFPSDVLILFDIKVTSSVFGSAAAIFTR